MAKLLHLIAILFATLCLTGPAFAHASLIGSSPAPNALLPTSPPQLTLSFNEPVSPTALTLLAPNGASTALTDFTLVDASLLIPVRSPLTDGTYVLSYRIVSEDGHPVAGSVIFSIGSPSAGAPTSEPIDWPLRLAIWLDKTLLYLGLLIGVAGVFFWHFTARQSGAPRPIRVALAFGIAAAPISVGLQGLDLLGRPLTASLDPTVWSTGFATTLGPSALIATAALLAATAASYLRNATILSTIAFAGIGLVFAATGHASAVDPQWLTRPAVFLHGLAVAYWIGALLPLWLLLRHDATAALPALRRFSRAIPIALLAMLATGLALAIIQLGSLDGLLTTPYGRVFIAKMALVLILLALAAFNRWRLTRPTEAGDAVATSRLVRAIAVEMLLAVAILGTVAIWRFTPPPRTLVAAVAVTPLSVHVHTDQAMAQVTFSSDQPGPMSASIYLMSGDFGALDAKALTVELSNPGIGIEPVKYDAARGVDGSWTIDHLTIPAAGEWSLNLGIRVSDFQMVRLQENVAFGQEPAQTGSQ